MSERISQALISSSGEAIIFKHLPTAAILPNVTCVIAAGSYINSNILLKEIKIAGLNERRLIIDPNAAIITNAEITEENDSELRKEIGSTLNGTGTTVINRIRRNGTLKLAKNDERLLLMSVNLLPSCVQAWNKTNE